MFILGPKMIFSPQFGNIKGFPKKSKAVSLNQFLMPGNKYNLEKFNVQIWRKAQKELILGPKTTQFWI